MSVRTMYKYIDIGALITRNIDLKRKVKFKTRKVHKTQIKDRAVFENRTYDDFKALNLQLNVSKFYHGDYYLEEEVKTMRGKGIASRKKSSI